MQTEDIRQLAEWLAATDIDFLALSGPCVAVEIHRDGAAPHDGLPALPAEQPMAAGRDKVALRAPSLGVLLDRVPGRELPLCAPGAAVQAGSLLALLRVGALLLPVRAPCDGWAGDWQVAPGSTVGHGTHLLSIDIDTAATAAA